MLLSGEGEGLSVRSSTSSSATSFFTMLGKSRGEPPATLEPAAAAALERLKAARLWMLKLGLAARSLARRSRSCSVASFSWARCSRSCRCRFTSSSICCSSLRTRTMQFSGILMPERGRAHAICGLDGGQHTVWSTQHTNLLRVNWTLHNNSTLFEKSFLSDYLFWHHLQINSNGM